MHKKENINLQKQLSNQETMEAFYTNIYKDQKHDSPDKSRLSIRTRIIAALQSLPYSSGNKPLYLLDIGSGPQSLEKDILKTNPKIDGRAKIISVDYADINNLLAERNTKKNRISEESLNIKFSVEHVRASGINLPFKDASFDLIFSNHALDFIAFIDKAAYIETYRVLSKGGQGIFYFHHPDMIPEDLSSIKNLYVKSIWSKLKSTKFLFDSEDAIKQELIKYGFKVEECYLNNDKENKWWETVLKKS